MSVTSQPPVRRDRRPATRTRVLVLALAAAVLAGVALYLFQPWRLFTSTTVNEAAPVVAATAAGSPDLVRSPTAAGTPGGAGTAAATTFQSLEHRTTGTVTVLHLPDGTAVLRLTDLATSDGPDVRVWLSAKPVDQAADAGSGAWLELGPLKGNRGDQNYTIPAGTDLSRYASVVLWCRRFSVAFGAAALPTP